MAHFIRNLRLFCTACGYQRYCQMHQHISITLNLLATWSKPLNSNQRTTPECRASFERQVLNTVWAESLKNLCLSNWQDNKRIRKFSNWLQKSQSRGSLSKHAHCLIRWLDMLGGIGKRHWSNASLWGGELYAGHGWFWRRVVWYLCYEDSRCCTDVGLSQLRVYGRWPYRFGLTFIQTDEQFWFK